MCDTVQRRVRRQTRAEEGEGYCTKKGGRIFTTECGGRLST